MSYFNLSCCCCCQWGAPFTFAAWCLGGWSPSLPITDYWSCCSSLGRVDAPSRKDDCNDFLELPMDFLVVTLGVVASHALSYTLCESCISLS